jgi:hypothetical protein
VKKLNRIAPVVSDDHLQRKVEFSVKDVFQCKLMHASTRSWLED